MFIDKCFFFVLVTKKIFETTKTFNAKAGHEIRQKLSPLGFEIEYLLFDDQIAFKVCQ